MFVTVEQCKKIIRNYLTATGRGGFMTGTISSVSPLRVRVDNRFEIFAGQMYVTDSCIGLRDGNRLLRPPLNVGEGVLLLCRPGSADGVQYILLDRIQPYSAEREVRADAAGN